MMGPAGPGRCATLWLLRRRIIWYFLAHLSFLTSINVITKTTYHSHSYNCPNSVILVYSASEAPLQLCLFFSLLCFSLLMIDCSQSLTNFNFLWIFRSYSLWFFRFLLHLIFFCHFINIFFLYNTLDFLTS